MKNLDVAYGHAKALHDVSLSLKQGETSFVIGRNGAGKTTLLKTITGLLKPVKGSIIYEGRDISGLPPEKISLEGIRYVAQEKKVFGNLTVRENIELAAYGLGEPMEQALDKVIGLYPKIKNFLKIEGGPAQWRAEADPPHWSSPGRRTQTASRRRADRGSRCNCH